MEIVRLKNCKMKESDDCVESLNSDLVKREVSTIPTCITLHPGFTEVCLATWSLRLAGQKYRKMDKKNYEVHGDENRYSK